MHQNNTMIAFGPVPSRRLGQSLGINTIPPKHCSYACIYCQVGRTTHMQVDRASFYSPEQVVQSVAECLEKSRKKGEHVDYIAFVPDGEPTLDIHIGEMISKLKSFHKKIAVITNATLLSRADVRHELAEADWVSVSVDAVTLDVWKKINRPHKRLHRDAIHDGIMTFSRAFDGELTTETMLVRGVNDYQDELENIAHFILDIQPSKSYISIPIRPPAERNVMPPSESSVNLAYQIFANRDIDVEYLIGYEGNSFAYTGDIGKDVLSIASVHPIREEGLCEILRKADKDWTVIKRLIIQGRLVDVDYQGKTYYVRKFGTMN